MTTEFLKIKYFSSLVGTKWVLNSTIDVSSSFSYAINFTTNSGYICDGIICHALSRAPNVPGPGLNYVDSTDVTIVGAVAWVYSVNDNTWFGEQNRIITITGGTDATNHDLIDWLFANATLVPVVDLTYTMWTITSNPIVSGYGHYDLDFDVDGAEYDIFALGYSKSSYHGGGSWVAAQSNWYTLAGDIGDDISVGDSITFYNDGPYPDLIVWLTNNATFRGYTDTVHGQHSAGSGR